MSGAVRPGDILYRPLAVCAQRRCETRSRSRSSRHRHRQRYRPFIASQARLVPEKRTFFSPPTIQRPVRHLSSALWTIMQTLSAWVTDLYFRVPTPNTATITVVSRRAMHLAGLYDSPGTAPCQASTASTVDLARTPVRGRRSDPTDCGEAMILPTDSQAGRPSQGTR